MSKYDRRGHGVRESFVEENNITREARKGGNTSNRTRDEKGTKLGAREFSPQRTPFSNAAQECDMATTPENYYRRPGMQPR